MAASVASNRPGGRQAGPVWMFEQAVIERYMQARREKQRKQQERG
jgi:hypothetical protein